MKKYLPAAALLLAVFAADLAIPLGVAVGVAHVAAVLWSLRWRIPKETLWVAVVASLLIALGFFLSDPVAAYWEVIFNRILALAAVWGIASVGIAVIRHEIDLRRQTRQLEEVTKELDEFVYLASHDLRTPLRGIQNLAAWIAEDDAPRLTEESHDRLEKLGSRSKRLELLLDGVSSYARSRRFDEKAQRFDLVEVLRNAVKRVPPGSCEFVIPADLPSIESYPHALTEVFFQVFDNAARHHDRVQGKVEVSCEEEPEGWKITISDDGRGIDPAFATKIFGMFETLKPKDESERAGVGLAFARKLMTRLGGAIELEPTDGRGSTFLVRVPR